jgi:hypothetical protein
MNDISNLYKLTIELHDRLKATERKISRLEFINESLLKESKNKKRP